MPDLFTFLPPKGLVEKNVRFLPPMGLVDENFINEALPGPRRRSINQPAFVPTGFADHPYLDRFSITRDPKITPRCNFSAFSQRHLS